jgi:hypothetical protein
MRSSPKARLAEGSPTAEITVACPTISEESVCDIVAFAAAAQEDLPVLAILDVV